MFSLRAVRGLLDGTPGMIGAETEGEISGALAWRTRGDPFQVVAFATGPMWQQAGVGGHLLAEA